MRKEHTDFRELASAIVAELGAADVEEVVSRHLDRRHWTLNPNRFSERLTKYRVECLNNFLEARVASGARIAAHEDETPPLTRALATSPPFSRAR